MTRFMFSVMVGAFVGMYKDPSATWCFVSFYSALSYCFLVFCEDVIKFFKWRAEQHDTAKHQTEKE